MHAIADILITVKDDYSEETVNGNAPAGFNTENLLSIMLMDIVFQNFSITQ